MILVAKRLLSCNKIFVHLNPSFGFSSVLQTLRKGRKLLGQVYEHLKYLKLIYRLKKYQIAF